MSLQKKCLTASAVTHGLLLLLVLVSSAFIPQKPKIEGPEFELFDIPAMLIDDPNMVGGGNPNAVPPPENAPVTVPAQPQQAPAKPPQPIQKTEPPPVVEPPRETVKSDDALPKVEKTLPPKTAAKETPKTPRVEPRDFDFSKAVVKERAKPAKAEPSFDLSKAERRTIKAPAETRRPAAATDTQVARAPSDAVLQTVKRLQGGLSSVGGTYDVPGPGGAAYASYHLALRKIYERAWVPPSSSRESDPAVAVEVIIRRDGTVVNSRITDKSGRSTLDRSVQDVLNRVKKVPPFPSGSTDETRTFRINFIQSDKLSG